MRHVEPLETRCLLSSFTASSVADLIANMNAANAAGGSNTIALAPASTFKLSAVENQTFGPTGLPIIAVGDDLTIVGSGNIIQRSSRTGTPAFRLFAVDSGGSLSLKNLTLSGGLALSSSDAVATQGGAIRSQGALNLNGVTVQDSVAQGFPALGGGIYSNGTLSIVDSILQNNQALGFNAQLTGRAGGSAEGGGLFLAGGNAGLTNTKLSSNLVRGGNGANGGKGGELGYIPGGDGGAGFGGAIYVAAGTVAARGNTIAQNAAQGGTAGNTRNGYSNPFHPPGHDGVGQGGGLYIYPSALASLDSFTQANTSSNTASTSDNDIFGSFSLLP